MTTKIQHTENGESGIFTAWQNEVQVGEMTYLRRVDVGAGSKETGVEDASIKPAIEQIVLNHTQVFDGFEGQGIARQMVMVAVDSAHENNRTIQPVCSYAKAVLTRTDEYNDILL